MWSSKLISRLRLQWQIYSCGLIHIDVNKAEIAAATALSLIAGKDLSTFQHDTNKSSSASHPLLLVKTEQTQARRRILCGPVPSQPDNHHEIEIDIQYKVTHMLSWMEQRAPLAYNNVSGNYLLIYKQINRWFKRMVHVTNQRIFNYQGACQESYHDFATVPPALFVAVLTEPEWMVRSRGVGREQRTEEGERRADSISTTS